MWKSSRPNCSDAVAPSDAEHWRATFFVASHAHSIVGGTSWDTTPWRAEAVVTWITLNVAVFVVIQVAICV